MPCVTEDDIKARLSTVSQRYPNATHYCYACVHGGTSRIEKSSDNGEPSGTAARPIMSVIKGNGLTDVIVVVVRYFGGTLLGTGGLVHAYTQGASDAIACASIVKKTACSVFRVTLGYDAFNGFQAKCRGFCAVEPQCDYSDKVDITVAVALDRVDEFLTRIAEISERHAIVVPLGDRYC
ncbi:MAG: YigZ family protein [archaeon]|nr:YigZ family protein [archaeon]